MYEVQGEAYAWVLMLEISIQLVNVYQKTCLCLTFCNALHSKISCVFNSSQSLTDWWKSIKKSIISFMQKSSFLNISLALEFELTLKYWLWRFTPGWSTELILKLHIMLWVLEANLINMWIYSILTSIWRVGSWAVEEAWWATQVAHGRTAIAIHAGGHVAVATLLRCGARHITMRRHAACVSIKAWGKENERDS